MLPGHTEETTIGREWEQTRSSATGAASMPTAREPVHVGGETATLVVWSPDYDGKGKALVRFADGARRSSAARASSAAERGRSLPCIGSDRRVRIRTGSGSSDDVGVAMRLIVARCEVIYTGRLNAFLPEATRLLMFKADGSVLVHADAGGYKPLNWMTPPTVVEEEGEPLSSSSASARARREDRLEIRIAEILSDVEHDMGEAAGAREGRRRARPAGGARRRSPSALGEGLRLVRREWPTDIGPVDLMCRDADDGWVAVEIKRIGDDRRGRAARPLPRAHPARPGAGRRAAASSRRSSVKKQARTLAEARGIDWVEVDLELLRGEREPELTLFAG